jgi:hypothetical protein
MRIPVLRRAAAAMAVVAILLLAASHSAAERTRFWRQSSFEEFDKGTAQGVALRSDGKLMLAPRFVSFADPNLAYVWAARTDSRGRLYVAGGSSARVLRFDAEGQATTVFESAEMTAQAIAFDARDNLYVGTSPDGKVYRITPAGQQTVLYEPGTKYIWDIVAAPDGTVYVATGDKGEVFAVGPDGKGRLYYQSEETHARSLALDRQGRLLVGTEPNGLIVRLEPVAGQDAPRAFVLYETDRKEVTALAIGRDGNLYAASLGAKSRIPAPPTVTQPAVQPPTPPQQLQQQTQPQPGAQQQQQLQQQLQQQVTSFIPFRAVSGGSEVYRIAADGSPEVLWSSREDLVYALGFAPTGKLLLGTGNRGIVFQLEGDGVYSNLAKTSSGQVTALAAGSDGRVWVATANPGYVFSLGPDYETEGTFESQPFDARIFSEWGRISWWGENGSTNGKVSLFVRSGNTSNPERNWSPWAGPYTDAAGAAVAAPPARFVQWKAVFRSADGQGRASRPGETPNLVWVSLAYLRKNVAPVVDAVVLQEPGVRVVGFTPPQQAAAAQPVPLRLPQSGQAAVSFGPGASAAAAAAAAQQPQPTPRRPEPPLQGFAQRGTQSVIWTANDENEDDLRYSVYYRGEGEREWKPLAENLDQRFHSWDTTAMPDGAYYLRLVASDAASNPAGAALSAERVSERFLVDNTPPEIVGLEAAPQSREARVRFTARDSATPLLRAEYSLNAGEWRQVLPADRVMDSREESFEFTVPDLSPGEHTLAVRVFDQFENVAAAKVTFTVAAPRR